MGEKNVEFDETLPVGVLAVDDFARGKLIMGNDAASFDVRGDEAGGVRGATPSVGTL